MNNKSTKNQRKTVSSSYPPKSSNGYHDQVGYDVVKMILDFCKEAKSILEIMEKFGFDSRTRFRRKYLNVWVKDGRLKMTLPDKPKSKNQKYYS